MSKANDLTGRTFGLLKVLRRVEDVKPGRPMWLCECRCGKSVVKSSTSLTKQNGVKSCGCLRHQKSPELIDLTDVPYGSNASYTGDTPVKTDVEKPEDYEFSGWNPSPNGITGNTDCYAQYRFIGYISVGIVERSISGDYSNDRVTTVGAYAFQNCSGLTSVSFPNVTSIGDYAFNAAHKLAKADLPKVTSIGQHGFSAANALEALILRNAEKVCSLGSDAVSYTKISSGSGYIYVPAALVDSYKAAANWKNYADQIRAIEDYPEITGGES